MGDRARPLNVEGVPLFGWLPQDSDGDEVQSAYQIQVFHNGSPVWDSGKMMSAAQSYVPYGGPPLAPASGFTWTVRTWDKDDLVSPWAAAAGFDTGISDGDWGASWIRRSTTEADDYTLARTEVQIGTSPIVRARTYTAAVHTYELYLNGTRVDRGTSFGYPGEQYYQAADVTDAITPGQRLAVGVLYHWYGSGQGRPAGERGLLLRLVVEHEDGTKEVIVTDGSWRVTRATQFSSGSGTRNGEGDRIDRQDGRGVIAGWDRPGFDASAWEAPQAVGPHPSGVFTHLIGLEPRIMETEISPASVTTLADGAMVADFGVVIPARPRLRFRQGVAGRSVDILASYGLAADGHASTAAGDTQATNMAFPYIQRDGDQVYEAFTHLAFRYLQIPAAAGSLAPEDIKAIVVHADAPIDRAATFDSSDATLDQVWDLVRRSALYSVQEAFVDTPTREKGQFLGDAVDISYATMSGWAERDATQKAIREFGYSQTRHWSAENRMNAVYPNGDGKRDIPDYTEQYPNWVWRYYMQTGDRSLLADTYPIIRNVATYVWAHRNASTGLITNLAGGSGQYQYGIVDWPASMRYGYDMNTSARTTVNIWAVDVLRSAANAAEALGRPPTEVAQYRQQATDLVTAINSNLRREDGTYTDGLVSVAVPVVGGLLPQLPVQSPHASQHANSFALAFDIAPAADRGTIADYVSSLGMQQGPMTAHWLLKGLSEAGRPDAVVTRLTDPSTDGWAKILSQGATFTWEAWVLSGNESKSHGWGSHALVDIQETLLGVGVTEAGAASITIAPPSRGLESARGTVPTQRGEVAVDWRRTPAGMTLAVDVPVNVRAKVALPVEDSERYTGTGAGNPRFIELRDGRAMFEVGSGRSSFAPAQ